MRNSRFIELLNLYVDQQLSPEDAAELENAVAEDENRRRTYNQYCRMQKACALLFEQERALAPSNRLLSMSLAEADRKMQNPGNSYVFGRLLYPIGIAAAVCFALTITHRPEKRASVELSRVHLAPGLIDQSPEARLSPAAQFAATKNLAATTRINLLPVFGSRGDLSSAVDENSADLVVENTSETNSNVSTNWMRDLELAPIAPLNEQITLKPISTTFESRSLHPRRANGQSSESAAFQFQR